MIRKGAVNAFLNRPRNDYSTYKNLTDSQIFEIYKSLPVTPPIFKTLRRVQRICFLIGAMTHRFALLLDTGMGKTYLCIALARYFQAIGICKHILVLVPTRINKAEWVRQIRKHSPNTSYCVLSGTTKEKWEMLQTTDALLIIETYPGLMHMLCKTVAAKRKKKTKVRWVPDPAQIKQFQKIIDGAFLDEATAVKSKKALPYRLCRQISKTAKIFFTLTGTPFGRDPSDLWAQMYLVDHGETLGETLGLFRAAFFTEKKNYWGGMEYTFDKAKDKLLNRILANRSIRYEADPSTMPRVNRIARVVSLAVDAELHAKSAKDMVLAARGNYRDMKNAFLRMRQISSGFLGYYDDDDGSKAQFVFPYCPKLELLLSDIESIPPSKKIIVFYEFTASGNRIVAELKKRGIKNILISGKTKKADESLAQFVDDPNFQVCVLQNSFTMGLNIQVAKYGMFFESPVSPITRKQAERRVERQESAHEVVFIYDYVTRGTFDERILGFLKEGRDLFKAIIDESGAESHKFLD